MNATTTWGPANKRINLTRREADLSAKAPARRFCARRQPEPILFTRP